MRENNLSQDFENLPVNELADLLRQFYGTVLSKNGKEYSKSGLINLRCGLNRHLHSPPFKKSFDLMNDRIFTQANLVLTGRLRDNKDKGLDTSAAKTSLKKDDVEKLFCEYFPKCLGDNIDTEILLHKVFWDIMYYTGRRGKEGLRKLSKNSFALKRSPSGDEYIEITFNEKTKKNQGDSLSTAANALHNNHHVITEIHNSPLCPVSSFKMYLDLLNPESTAFFQHPNKAKTGYTREVIGKNPLGDMMKQISKKAKLSRSYTNHQIRKTTVTGMHKEGFSLQEIANVTKHKNLDSLKHYVNAPSLDDKKRYNDGLFSYGNAKITNNPQEKRKNPDLITPQPTKRQDNKENSDGDNSMAVAVDVNDRNIMPNNPIEVRTDMRHVLNNELRTAPNLFHNATFTNCNFNFSLPQSKVIKLFTKTIKFHYLLTFSK